MNGTKTEKKAVDPVLLSLSNLAKDVNVPLQAKKVMKVKELQALHDHIQSLYKLYDKQQKQLIHLTHDPDKIESFAVIENLVNATEETADETSASIQQYNSSIAAIDVELANVSTTIADNTTKLNSLGSALTDLDGQLKKRLQTAATRDRMLQLSQERNIYKKKVIYVLLAIIIALITAILASYNVFSKK